MSSPTKYDVIVIGSGLGGLLTAVLLAKQGMSVCVLEKNKQIGGCLQTFSLHKKVFDSCVHYIGGLGDGHTLHQIFKYAGILDKLQLKGFSSQGFDRIAFGDSTTEYPQAAGNEHFVEQLLAYFPNERTALEKYRQTVKDVTSHFPLYHLRNGDPKAKEAVAGLELTDVIAGITDNHLLQQVLLGNNLLYAGVRGKTPFYLHALVAESYMHSAHKIVPGSSEISRFLGRELRKHGGEIVRNAHVCKLLAADGKLTTAVTTNNVQYEAAHFIAAIHPALLSSLLDPHLLRPAFHQRVEGLAQTTSSFMVNLVLEPGKVSYKDYNLYWHATQDALQAIDATDWPATYALYYGEDKDRPGFADRLSILTYMDAARTQEWADTHNSTTAQKERGSSYHSFKEAFAQKLIDKVGERLTGLKEHIIAESVATPLTFRDYTGTPDGSLYGIMKDVGEAARTNINIRTRIPNLLLTGQNVNMHGVLGVSVTAVLTAAELLGLDYLLEKINEA